MNPVSIIITCYNKRPYLAEAVYSALQNDPLEIIVVDDGSLDGSLMEAEKLQHQDSRIQIIAQANLGAAAARNAGWQRAKAEWIVFLDGDDRLTPSFATKTISAAHATRSLIVSGNAAMFGVRSDVWQPQRWDPYYIRYDNSLPITSLVSLKLVEDVGGFNVSLPFAEDWDFWIRCGATCPAVQQLAEILYEYRRTESDNLSGFVDDKWELTAPLMMLANPAVYNVEDLKYAVTRFMERGHEWGEPISKHTQRHPSSALLKLLQGLMAEGRGDNGSAIQHYAATLGISAGDSLALWRLGKLLTTAGQPSQGYALLHQARILRPDFHFLVGTTLKEIEQKLAL